MYTHNTGLTQELTIVDDLFILEANDTKKTYTLVPDAKAEMIIPLRRSSDLKNIGSVRSITLDASNVFFFMPRRRGAEVILVPNSKMVIVKINPIFAKKISYNLDEISNGVFTIKLDQNQTESLYNSCLLEDAFSSSEVIEEICVDSSDLFDYNMTILKSIEHVKESRGMISIKEIYSLLNISKSKLEQHFNREVGLTPKEFCKIEKLNCFINSYTNDPSQSLTELTYQCGYYDQSHLIKDFKYFLDTSPKKFFTEGEISYPFLYQLRK